MTKKNVKLTTLTTKGGCGCKIGPADLADILKQLPSPIPNPNVLVGLDTSDDAGVYQINKDTAIVQTVDFFTPIVDDPYSFGQIAAANAISDIYAMGGTPITALNIVAFPVSTLDKQILTDILRGAGDKLTEAGVALVGGHSIDDKEPKFGLAVTGIVHPDKVRTNSGVQPNDKLILTKPIGVGVLTTSIKRNLLTEAETKHVTEVMATLNKTAADIMQHYEVHACTDVTGFGLLGHATEMAIGSGVSLTIYDHKVPKLPRVKELAELGAVPGGTKNNFQHVEGNVTFPSSMDQIERWILCDAVTSGGLLMAVKDAEAAQLLSELQAKGIHAAIIGEATEDTKSHIYVQE
ncbi:MULTISPECIES: selenide, water dikinase SelD [Clostridia]|uniref:selenide, water dikinase SelD n=1 Tax=Clostridia TaxID=186801 RepID=UPI000EA2BE34|nr:MULTISPECIES: selenide, water dikinase SelD [Clostridia]NBJ70929.1 selenide, water dikinase SelD [Roseburia sp. 1XD42-34]RKI75572.1 selenide, water dikinase SelD [Clostridium sp. 1xD42-85]